MDYSITVTTTTPCSNEKCKHKYGDHAVSYDGTKDGCLFVDPGYDHQRDYTPASRCMCKGFQVTYRPPRPAPQSSRATFDPYER